MRPVNGKGPRRVNGEGLHLGVEHLGGLRDRKFNQKPLAAQGNTPIAPSLAVRLARALGLDGRREPTGRLAGRVADIVGANDLISRRLTPVQTFTPRQADEHRRWGAWLREHVLGLLSTADLRLTWKASRGTPLTIAEADRLAALVDDFANGGGRR